MASLKEKDELDKFLRQVDSINSIVKDMTTDDVSKKEKALKEADDFLAKMTGKTGQMSSMVDHLANSDKETQDKAVKNANQFLQQVVESKTGEKLERFTDRTGVNRTVINKDAFKDEAPAPGGEENMGQEAFMAAMEVDARDRFEKRKKREKESNIEKDLGNEQFKLGNYEKAIEYYTKGLGIMKDNTALYTNRAQAFIKLEKYHEALEDCDWALRVFENCLKAYVHQGRAYLGLKQYEKAIESFQMAQKVDPTKLKAIQGYLSEVEQARSAEEEEKEAQRLFEEGHEEAKSMVHIFERINSSNQLPLFYSGGMRLLCNCITDNKDRTLFRTNGGFELLTLHPTISRCFRASPPSLSRQDRVLLGDLYDMLAKACTENDENQKQVVEIAEFPEQTLSLLEAKTKSIKTLKEPIINFLHTLSQQEVGRQKIVQRFDIPRLLSSLFSLMAHKGTVALNAVGLLSNLALETRFKQLLRDRMEEHILPSFENLMRLESVNPSVLPACISTITNLTGDPVLRRHMVRRRDSWQAVLHTLNSHTHSIDSAGSQDIVYSLLGLLVNLTVESSPAAVESSPELCKACCPLVGCERHQCNLEERACRVLSRILPHSPEAVDVACNMGLPAKLVPLLKSEDEEVVKSAVKGLTACTQTNETARNTLVWECKGLGALIRLLKCPDETVVGNAALCLSHCAALKGVSARLTETTIIQDLLVLARDGRKRGLQQNTAILLAKLAQGDQRHLEKLRELHGIEILHDCMKYIK